MPLWKERCVAFRDNDMGGILENRLVKALHAKGIYHPAHSGQRLVPQVGEFLWLLDGEHSSLLVVGVMLFTWEQGIAP